MPKAARFLLHFLTLRLYLAVTTAIEVLQLFPQQNQVEAFVGDDPTYGKGHVGLDVFLKVFRFTLGQSLRLLGKASESEMAKAADRDEKRGSASMRIQVCLFEKVLRCCKVHNSTIPIGGTARKICANSVQADEKRRFASTKECDQATGSTSG